MHGAFSSLCLKAAATEALLTIGFEIIRGRVTGFWIITLQSQSCLVGAPRREKLRGFSQALPFPCGVSFNLSMYLLLPKSEVEPFMALLCIISCRESCFLIENPPFWRFVKCRRRIPFGFLLFIPVTRLAFPAPIIA